MVDLLNGFFAVVVDVVHRHGGFVNKFEGDGALCVFGAPVDREIMPPHALAAAREPSERLSTSGARAAIGVSLGTAVAGTSAPRSATSTRSSATP